MTIPILLRLALFVLFPNMGFLGLPSLNQARITEAASAVLSAQSEAKETVISKREFSMEKRYPNAFVNEVFKDNILLNIAYMEGKIDKNKPVNWTEVVKPFHYEFSLKPNEIFAYHEDVLPQYKGKVAKTTNAHFNSGEQFKSDGYLVGDGVCHLASLIYWAAKDASLDAVAPTNHNFADIPEVPREYGVSIYSYPGRNYSNQVQNLYITNNKTEAVTFHFNYDGKNLKISVSEAKTQSAKAESKAHKKLVYLFPL